MLAFAVRASVLLSPLVGVGVGRLLFGSDLGSGLQPAMLPMLLAIAVHGGQCARSRTLPGTRGSSWTGAAAWALLLWLLTSCAWTWRFDEVGLLGEVPWSKSAKQAVLLGFFALSSAAAARAVTASRRDLHEFERPLGVAMAMVLAGGVLQQLHAVVPGPWVDRWWAIFSSNPSIAAGSEELYLGDRFVGIARLRSTFPEPLLLGSWLVVAVPLVFGVATRRRGHQRLRWVLLGALGAVYWLLTFSRGAWAGGVATLVLLALGSARGRLPRPRRRTVALGAGLALAGGWVLGAVLVGGDPWATLTLLPRRLAQSFEGQDMSNLTRFWSWGAAWSMWEQSPIAGAGWGSFGFHYFRWAGPERAAAHFGWPVSNNLPLQVLAEGGLIALALAGLAAGRVRRVWRGAGGGAAYVLFCGMSGLLVQTLTFSQWNLPHLWLGLGVLWGLTEWTGTADVRAGVV